MSRSEESLRLQTVAEELVALCPPELGTEIALTGSAGRGNADEHSDIELNLLTPEAVTPESCGEWLRQVGAEDIILEPQQDGSTTAWARYRGVEIEPGWDTAQRWERRLGEVLAAARTDHESLMLADVVTYSVTLRTEGLLAELNRRLASYPEPLRRRLIDEKLADWRIPAYYVGPALRGDRLPLQEHMIRHVHRVLRVLCAHNRIWEPHWKWIARLAGELERKPNRLAERIDALLLEESSRDAYLQLVGLVGDTLDLLEDEFDVSRARDWVARKRAALSSQWS